MHGVLIEGAHTINAADPNSDPNNAETVEQRLARQVLAGMPGTVEVSNLKIDLQQPLIYVRSVTVDPNNVNQELTTTDLTDAARSTADAAVAMLPNSTIGTYVAFGIPSYLIDKLAFDVGTFASGTLTFTWQYLSGSTWIPFSDHPDTLFTDGTESGGAGNAFRADGTVSWFPAGQVSDFLWALANIDNAGEKLLWLRAVVATSSGGPTIPTLGSISISTGAKYHLRQQGTTVMRAGGITCGNGEACVTSGTIGSLSTLPLDDDTPEAGEFGALALTGDVTSSGLATTIGSDKVLESMLKVVNAGIDEDCLTRETTTGDFEWQACSGGGGEANVTADVGAGAISIRGTTPKTGVALNLRTLAGADFDTGSDIISIDAALARDSELPTGGAGLSLTGTTMATASQEAAFLADGGVTSLTCGSSNQGKMQVLDNGALEYCDGAATSLLQTIGYLAVEEADASPSVTPVDTIQFDQADGFTVTNETGGQVQIDIGSIPAARGGTGIDSSASSGVPLVTAGVWSMGTAPRIYSTTPYVGAGGAAPPSSTNKCSGGLINVVGPLTPDTIRAAVITGHASNGSICITDLSGVVKIAVNDIDMTSASAVTRTSASNFTTATLQPGTYIIYTCAEQTGKWRGWGGNTNVFPFIGEVSVTDGGTCQNVTPVAGAGGQAVATVSIADE